MSRRPRARWWGPHLEWAVATLLVLGVAVLARTLLASVASPGVADRWLLVAGAVLCAEGWLLRSNLARTRAGGGAAPLALGLPTLLTICRGGLYAAVAGFLLVPPAPPLRWAPGICYGAGVVLDSVDGALARRTDSTTDLGTRLDMAFDTVGFLVAPLVGVAWGRLPVWFLALSAARYLYRGGRWWRRRRGRPVGDLPQSRARRPLAGFQMVFITVALWPVVPAAVVETAAAVALAPSLLVFARDYLAVSGRLGG